MGGTRDAKKKEKQTSAGQSNTEFLLNMLKAPLNIEVGVEEASLPQAGNLLRLLLRRIPRHGCEQHQGLPFLGHHQELFRFGRVHLGEVDGRWGSFVLRQIALFDVIVFL